MFGGCSAWLRFFYSLIRSADVILPRFWLVSVQQGVFLFFFVFLELAPHLDLRRSLNASQDICEDLYPSNYAPGPTHTHPCFLCPSVSVYLHMHVFLNSLYTNKWSHHALMYSTKSVFFFM